MVSPHLSFPGTAARRQQERGAAVFIVVMVVTLLTAVGIFAIRSASLVDVASGYNRQSLQTEYVADYGVLLTAHELSTQAASAYTNVAQTGTDDCLATRNVNSAVVGQPFCYAFQSEELGQRFNGDDGLFEESQGLPGTLIDPVGADSDDVENLEARFVVEMTEAFQTGNVRGADLTSNQLVPVQVTLTARGFVNPPRADAAVCNDAAAAGGIQEVRSHVVLPAVPRFAR
ncbi:MAG TPA: hypothetical protein VI197_22985 [Polyangiaceae bacterium]